MGRVCMWRRDCQKKLSADGGNSPSSDPSPVKALAVPTRATAAIAVRRAMIVALSVLIEMVFQ